MKISVFLVTLMAASSMALPMIISPIPMAVRDIAVAGVLERDAAAKPPSSSNGNFRREAEAGGEFKREAAGTGSGGRGVNFKREAGGGNGSGGRGVNFKREAGGGNGSGGRGVNF